MKAKEARCKQSNKEQSKGAIPQQKTTRFRNGRYSTRCSSLTKAITMGRKRINGICKSYSDVGANEALAIFGSSGYLEISINRGSARDVLDLKKGDKLDLGN